MSEPRSPSWLGYWVRRLLPASAAARWALLAAGVALAGGAVWLVAFSPVLDARRVQVVGTELLTEEQVREAARVPLGGPLARVDTAAAERAVAELSRVDSVRVSRVWPHTVRVEVVEHRTVALLDEDGRLREVDEHGVVFEEAAGPLPGVPVVRVAPDGGPSGAAFPRAELLAGAAEVALAVPEELRERTEVVRMDSWDDVRLELTDGSVVVWGSPEDSARKAEVLTDMLAHPAAVYDVSVPEQPALGGLE
ncbi:cell division protein FtsQ/DivIB [Allostreptomyces psammosilenae]|uniref:Cell division protein FtsQ n=1 Tax=Allostreptomyces psammosilenae TaxID=1892865 RepID=A0A853A9L8_9ACTN|nr:FtsQ-type POTRA domain-containing protein [Allostreptomyces psammosilenae]NYI07102.1 cell division protein FtsQ [Allostreptomyces psammosilenae]